MPLRLEKLIFKVRMQESFSAEFIPTLGQNSLRAAANAALCVEDGMIFDDGVTSCINDNHFIMTTTSVELPPF